MNVSPADAVELLSQGKIVAVPTETVYGLAADALNPAAIARIFEIKNRPADNPLICHFFGERQIREYVTHIPSATEILMRHFSPGPISFMLDLPADSPLKFATCGSPRIIARIPDHSLFLEIIEQLNRPVAAPSANTSGRLSPTTAEMVEKDLGEKLDGIVDGGMSRIGIESTIIDAGNGDEILILRPGAIGSAEILRVLPDVRIISQKVPGKSVTPGTKYRHYAPSTPVFLIQNIEELGSQNAALMLTEDQLTLLSPMESQKLNEQSIDLLILGSMDDLNKLAKNFYHKLSLLDSMRIKKAFILKNDWGDTSLGKAIKNRIEKLVFIQD